jgi:hypothetical protein
MAEDKEQKSVAAVQAEIRAPVKEMAAALRKLHLALVDHAQQRYEAVNGEVDGAGKLLQLLAHDPEFWWLRTLSILMVEIDEMLDNEELVEADAATVRSEVEKLILSPAKEDSEFARNYVEALQSDPSVVMEHSNTRKVLAKLPQPAGTKE